MSQYETLAAYYDRIIEHDFHQRFAARCEQIFSQYGEKPALVLDLACGTGLLTRELGKRGHEMISIDASVEMLDRAYLNCADLPVQPVFICQDMTGLDLYGTIDAAVCSLDGINYLAAVRDLKETFRRIHLFLNPGGLLIFDVKSVGMFRRMGGTVSAFETDDCYCVWTYDSPRKSGLVYHNVDMFVKHKDVYTRCSEEHCQRAYSIGQIQSALKDAGFGTINVYREFTKIKAKSDEGRLLFVAQSGKKHE